MVQLITLSALGVLFLMVSLFFLSLILRRDSVVDIAWGPIIAFITLLSFFLHGRGEPRQILVTLLVCLWGTRLALYLLLRSQGQEEETGYRQDCERRGPLFPLRKFFQVYLLQGTLLLVIVFPVLMVNHFSRPGILFTDLFALAVWTVGFLFEIVADRQLYRFKREPRNYGKLLQSGLWSLSRHPNYFGEALLWWGIAAFAWPLPGGWNALASPLLVTFLLLCVSGVPVLEEKLQNHPDFLEYRRRTSLFFPKPPRSRRNRE